jgi:hypothetical protein
MNATPEQVVVEMLDQHRHEWVGCRCRGGDWRWDGDNDFDEHQADVIVAALKSAGYIATASESGIAEGSFGVGGSDAVPAAG